MSRKRSRDAIEAYRQRFYDGSAARGVDAGDGRAGLREAPRLRLVRLPEVARGGVRAARLPVGLASPSLSGRVPLRAPERPADGLLPAGEPRPGRAAARDRGAAARCQPRARRGAGSRETPSGSGSRTSRASGRSRRRRSSAERQAGGPFRSVPDLAQRAPLDRPALEALVGVGRLRLVRLAEAAAPLAARARAPLGERRRRAAPSGSSRSRSSRRRRFPSCRSSPPGSACSPTTARRRSRSARTRSSCCARTFPPRSPRAPTSARLPARRAGGGCRARRRPPAAVDGERRRLHAPRGRARAGEPRSSRRPSTTATGRPSAASRCSSPAAASR